MCKSVVYFNKHEIIESTDYLRICRAHDQLQPGFFVPVPGRFPREKNPGYDVG
jgi:hypothetical protein